MSYGDKVASIFQTALEQFIPQAGKESQSIQLARDIKSINQEIARDKQEIAQSKQNISKMDQEIAQSKQNISKMDQEIAQSKQNISKMDQEIARDKQEISMLDKANLLRDEIYAIILKFNPDDKQTLERIQNKLNELNNLRNGIDKKSKTYEILV
jgi:septal ring factor EnvC (AmiA/AmiB activator)